MKGWKITEEESKQSLQWCDFCELKNYCLDDHLTIRCDQFLKKVFKKKDGTGYPVFLPLKIAKKRRF